MSDTIKSERIDKALSADLLAPPEDFTARVMAMIAAAPLPAPVPRPPRSRLVRESAEWLALAGAVVAGMAQLLPLLFGLWTYTNTG